MDIDLQGLRDVPSAGDAYSFVPWHCDQLDDHANALFESFRDEVDAQVFPSLSCREGCRFLMRDISNRRGFVAAATWLIAWAPPAAGAMECAICGNEPCGSIQGVRIAAGLGAIQNLGVVPEHRGRGLGTMLLLQALHGFVKAGLKRAYLEVTASNELAIRLYRNLGFRKTKTLYKAIDLNPTEVAVVE
jgi:hypothetical protein